MNGLAHRKQDGCIVSPASEHREFIDSTEGFYVDAVLPEQFGDTAIRLLGHWHSVGSHRMYSKHRTIKLSYRQGNYSAKAVALLDDSLVVCCQLFGRHFRLHAVT